MPRPGPLQEISLDHFLPQSPTRKRPLPLSPGELLLYSPAKRRILNEEGIYTPKSPLRTARFSHILAGPSSPAKKLDFGSPKQPSSSRLRANDDDLEMDDYFSQPSSSLSIPSSSVTPPPPDPQSIHYPGFRIYFDVPINVDEAPSLAADPSDNDNDVVKENIAPRRKTRKASTAPPETDPMSQLLSPPSKRRESERLKKAKSTPTTPKKFLMGERMEPGSPTPRRSIYGQRSATSAKQSMRRLLQEEVDDEESAMA
ncbi:hypothetical protein C0991_003534 [Blastosporella zonata]|nr:hypothetical protein C0991_003534 [Blastosporella zonata]